MADRCAVIERAPGGQWGDNCTRPIAARARWRFDDNTASLLLGDQHARLLADEERLRLPLVGPHGSRRLSLHTARTACYLSTTVRSAATFTPA